ncbi:MAG: hypothetical protein HRT61_24095, partial [Ekhidna sp.]|nr:hypothetical protein [Ekhidna sp.]
DLLTNRSLSVFVINTALLVSIIYLLWLSASRKLRRSHIFGFSFILGFCFALFWPASTGLSGAGAYVLQSLIIVLLLINRGRAKILFAGFALLMIGIAGFADIEYTGRIVYSSQLTSFIMNMIVIALIMNIFKVALDREQSKLLFRIEKLNRINEEISRKNEALEKNQQEIKRIQTDLQQIIEDRTEDIEKENARLIEYAFINAHLVRAPLANMLALGELINSEDSKFKSLKKSIQKLDRIVRRIGGVLSIETKP